MLSSTTFSITTPARVDFGDGAIHKLPDALATAGKTRAFVVTDPGVRAAGILDDVLAVLASAGVDTDVFDGVEANPSLATIDRAAEAARRIDDAAVVALGGGSSLDAAKCVALAFTNPVPAAALATLQQPNPGLPVVAVPTTAGTGAETNGFAVVEDHTNRRKVYLGHASVVPRAAILDPRLTIGLPPRATAATGVDALVHGVESLTSRSRNPVSEAYARQAVKLVYRWLPSAVADGGDIEARAQLILGAHLAGLALSISGLGLVHGLAHAVTAHTGAPHGIALASVLDRVLDFNLATSTTEYAAIALDLDISRSDDETTRACATVAALRAFTVAVGAHTRLRDLGVDNAMVPSLTRAALADPVTRNTPRMPTSTELTDLVNSAR
ncbi:iron-containing alcohol dehydrogenase [Micromonospora sp. WMMA1363]|uniref:iron-containing alcohol dehydrogenase family protein n=1 Tax=Micromonospora sp. WMMA1363 TaxID=3053985 RepID=UPI00259CCB72|nr:iron-containing alcohol dehydrogenase [Micromonospora sp. WMMA1363]MDM4718710.1 iron-containing alcohol dehydrogenase [Micromonospora sp. WMMA1363]